MPQKDIIGIVRRNLWSRGYRVKTAAEFYDAPLYHLLVEGKFRVYVARAGERLGPVNYDAVAVVSFDALKRPVILYTTEKGYTAKPGDVFDLPASFPKDEKNKKEVKKGGGKKAASKGRS